MDSPFLWDEIQARKLEHKAAQYLVRRLLGGSHELEGSPTKTAVSDVLEGCPAEKKGQTSGVEGSGYNFDLEMLHSRTGGIRSPQGSPPSQCREGRYCCSSIVQFNLKVRE